MCIDSITLRNDSITLCFYSIIYFCNLPVTVSVQYLLPEISLGSVREYPGPADCGRQPGCTGGVPGKEDGGWSANG